VLTFFSTKFIISWSKSILFLLSGGRGRPVEIHGRVFMFGRIPVPDHFISTCSPFFKGQGTHWEVEGHKDTPLLKMPSISTTPNQTHYRQVANDSVYSLAKIFFSLVTFL
jgi:hypothetical protein